MTVPASNRRRVRVFRAAAALALVVAVAFSLAGCGRKARPEPRFGCSDCPKHTT